MKILKIFGIVVGLHLLALILILANPGCSSSTHPAALRVDAPVAALAPPTIAVPIAAVAPAPADDATPAPVSVGFFPPTRPGTPAAEALVTAPAPDVTPAETYVVRSGDSLGLIARHHHLKPSELAAFNHLRVGSTLHTGQKLLIPGKSGAPIPSRGTLGPASASAPAFSAPASAGAASGKGETTYTVRSGDRLSTIAHRYGLTTGELAAANNITNPRMIRVGQALTIPAGHAARGKAKPAAAAPAPAAEAPAPAATPTPVTPVVPANPTDNGGSDAVPVVRIPSAGDTAAPSSAGPANPSN